MKSLELMRLEGLAEWQFVKDAIELTASDYNTNAADASTMERVCYYRGMRDGLRRALQIPEEVLREDRQEQTQDERRNGEDL